MAFATASELATLLRRSFDAPETAAADLVLDLVTAEIKAVTRQDIELVTGDVVALHGTWGRYIELPQWPVVSVSAISLNTFPVATGTWLLSPPNRLYRGNLPIFNGPDEWGGDLWVTSWLGPAATVTVTYTHGFATVPGDVKAVCLRAAQRFLNNPDDLSAETIGNYQYQREAGEAAGLLSEAETGALIERYSMTL